MIPPKRRRNPSAKGWSAEDCPPKVPKGATAHHHISSRNMPYPSLRTGELAVVSPSKESIPPRSRGQTARLVDVPDDILRRIFANFEPGRELCRLMEVCTTFAQAACAPELWSRVIAVDPVTRRLREADDAGFYQIVDYNSDRRVVYRPTQKRSKKTGTTSRPRIRKGVGLAVDVITSRAGSQLVSLDLTDCYPGFPRFDHQMSDSDLEIISTRCSESLEGLRLSTSFLVTGTGLVGFAKLCPKLRTLHMTGCKNITDKVFGAVVRACPTLEDISVCRCRSFRGSGLHENLSPIRSTLKRIDVSVTGVYSIYMRTFMRRYPALEEIKADGCENLEETGAFASSGDPLFPSLVSLNLDKISGASSKWLIPMCVESSRLLFLSLNMMGRDIFRLPDLFLVSWPPLKYLGMAGQPITDGMWQRIFEKLGASLVQCDMSKNKSLTGKLQAFRNDAFAELEELNMSSTGATDITVSALVAIAPKLKFLDISGCRGVERRMRRCPLAFRESVTAAELKSIS